MPASQEIISLTAETEEVLKKELREEDFTEALLNLVRGAIAAHEQAFHFPNLTKEAFLTFMTQAWDTGKHQRKVYAMKIEGNVNNEIGVALNFAACIAISGRKDGIIQ